MGNVNSGGERRAEVKRYSRGINSHELDGYGDKTVLADFVLAADYDALAAERDRLRDMLEEVEAWLEDREDVVDGDYGESAPNAEMRLLREVRAALSGGRT